MIGVANGETEAEAGGNASSTHLEERSDEVAGLAERRSD